MIERLRHWLGLCKRPKTFDVFLYRVYEAKAPGSIIECTAEEMHWHSQHCILNQGQTYEDSPNA